MREPKAGALDHPIGLSDLDARVVGVAVGGFAPWSGWWLRLVIHIISVDLAAQDRLVKHDVDLRVQELTLLLRIPG